MKRYAQMKKIIEFFNSPKISRMGEYMLTGRRDEYGSTFSSFWLDKIVRLR